MSNEMLKTSLRRIKWAHRLLICGIIACLVSAVVIAVLLIGYISSDSEPNVIVGNSSFPVELATTPNKRALGLSGRNSLKSGTGVLFVYEQPGIHCFWMKDMAFPIDIIWIDTKYNVIHVVEAAQPSSYPTSFCPPTSASYVLEINAGEALNANLTVGTLVKLEI